MQVHTTHDNFEQIQVRNVLSPIRILLLIVNFFLGYIFIYPKILTAITLWIDPFARTIPVWLQFLFYVFMIVVSIVLAWPLLIESYQNWKICGLWKVIKTIVILFLQYIFLGLLLSLLIQFLTPSTTSQNQTQVVSMIENYPLLSAFTTVIYAPIVEEILFRGVFYRCIRPYIGYGFALLISAFSFGFIHIMDALFQGNLQDLPFLMLYMLIGAFLARSYEKTQTLYTAILFHALYNAAAFMLNGMI